MMQYPSFLKCNLLLFLVLFSVRSTAQKKTELERNTAIVDSLFLEKDYENTLIYLEKFRDQLEKNENWKALARYLNKTAATYYGMRKYNEAKPYLEKSLKVVKKLNEPSMEEALALHHFAIYYQFKSNLQGALESYSKALDIHKKILPNDHASLADSYLKVAYMLGWTGQYDNALEYLAIVKDICERNKKDNLKNLRKYYSDIRIIQTVLGRTDEALISLQKEKQILAEFPERDLRLEARNLDAFARHYESIGDINKSLENKLKALSQYRQAVKIEDNRIILMYTNLATTYTRLGEYTNALNYAERALNLAQKLLGEHHIRVGNAYRAVGTVYASLKEHNKALNYFFLSVENLKKNYGEEHKDVGFRYDNIANIYMKTGQFDQALTYFQKSLDILVLSFGSEHPDLALTYQSLAMTHMRAKNREAALENFNKALSIAQKSFQEKTWVIDQIIVNLGVCYAHFGDYDNALIHLNKILDLYDADVKNLSSDSNSGNLKFDKLAVVLEAQKAKGHIFKMKYKKLNDVNYLKAAGEQYDIAYGLALKTREIITTFEDKLALAEANKELMEGAIESNFLLFEKTQDLKYQEKVFLYSELSKANTLQEILAFNESRSFAGNPSSIELQNSLKREQSYYLSQLENEKEGDSTSTKIVIFEEKLFETQRKYDSVVKVLQKEHPSYFAITKKTSDDIRAIIQEKLPKDASLIEFFYKDSITYISAVSKNTFVVKKIKTPDLQEKIGAFRKAIQEKNVVDYKILGHQLYNTLILPIKNDFQGNTIIVIPDGPLWHLNFELLLSSETASNNPKELPYLLRNFAFSYANSSDFFILPKRTHEKTLKECLAFSFSDSIAIKSAEHRIDMDVFRNTDTDLPGTRREIKEIANIVNGTYYYGADAIEANFKKNASNYAVLHLALHGEVNHKDPKQSKLYFTKVKDSIEDNYLYAHELFTLKLPAELAVLSACETGSGEIATGEGIMSIGNAFQYAGTKSLLLSSWKVSDQVAPELMKLFYQNLENGLTKPKALQKAKLDYLENTSSIRANPFYWGSFYIIGDISPIDIGGNNTFAFLGITLLILGIIGFFLLKHFRKKR